MNTPRYTAAEHLEFLIKVERANPPASMVNAIAGLGEYCKAIMVCGGPCFPSALAIASGQNLEQVCDKIRAVHTQRGDILDGVELTWEECERIPNVVRAALKGVANADAIRRVDLEGGTLSGLMRSGRTFVAIVSGGAHAVAIKGGKLYCTAGKTPRMRASFVYEIV